MSPFHRFKKKSRGDKDRKGGLPPIVTAGSASAPQIGTSVLTGAESAVSSSSPNLFTALGTLFGKLGQSTGLSALLATKAGVVAFVLTGTTLAAGVSLFMGDRGDAPSQRMSAPGRVFTGSDAPDSASSQVNAPIPYRPSAGSSLDYTPSAREREPLPESAAPPAAEPVTDAPSEPSIDAAAPASGAADQGAVAHQTAQMPKGRLVAAQSIAGAASAGGTSTAFKPVDSMGGKVGSGFQDIYKAGRTTGLSGRGSRPNMGASRRAVPSRANTALGQARKANALSRSAASMPSSNAAAATASKAFDGTNTGAGAGTPGVGVGDGAKGISPGDSNVAENKQIEPPAPPSTGEKSNKTPYQNLIYAGVGALLIGTILLMFAAQMIKSGNFPAAKMLAMGAAGAGGVAVGCGGMLAAKWGQVMQGIPFMAGGALLAAQAIKVMMEADKAAEDAEKGCKDQDAQAKSGSDAKLQGGKGGGCPGGDCGGSGGGGGGDSGGGADPSSALSSLGSMGNQGQQNQNTQSDKQRNKQPKYDINKTSIQNTP
ncbi:MAG TPA: hypothetical protein DCM05_08590 [Elusimicrobia bacterium]|nr:hypothetical protein [Elusimicrobiota bacterium]